VVHFQRARMMDIDQAAKAMRDEEMLAEIEDFIEGFNQPTYRGMRVNGVRVATWSSRHGLSGDSRPEAEWLHDGLQGCGPGTLRPGVRQAQHKEEL
jgi:hypothetical protein